MTRWSFKKNKGLEGSNGDWATIQLAHVAVMRGQPRKAAPLIMRLLEKRAAAGKPAWNLDSRSLGAIGVSMVRLMAAYLEDPLVPVSKARAGVELFLSGIEMHSELKTVGQIMPMIMSVRTDAPLDSFAAERRRSGLPLRTEMESSGMCAATHRQWRVEYLLAMGAEEDALDLAHRGRTEKPCGGTCAFAPHSMFAWLLEPLHRRGRSDEALVLDGRLAGLLTPRTMYLDAMGCRIHYLSLVKRFEEANKLMRAMMPLAEDPLASPWQRLKFYQGCERANLLAKSVDERRRLFAILNEPLDSMEQKIARQHKALRNEFETRLP